MKQTENLQLPVLQSGDKYTKETQNEAFKKIDLHLGGLAKRVNDIVASGGENNIEIVDARRDNITGVVHNTIGERINSVSEQLDTITKNKYDDVIISGNELSMKANGVVKKIIQLPSAGGTVEGHTHSNKLILDNITNNKVNNWDSAYEHSQSSHAPTNAQKNSDITKSEIEAKLVGEISSHTHDYAESGHNHDAIYSKLGHKHSKEDITNFPTKLSEFQNDIIVGNGVTPNITIGNVTTLNAGQQATVSKRGTNENPIFDFGIPRGERGSDATVEIINNLTTGGENSALSAEQGKFINSKLDSFKLIIDSLSERVGILENQPPNTFIPVTGIEVDNWDVKLEVGQTKQLNARIIPANATNQNVNWFSNNTSVATVNSTGLIRAVEAGYAKITVTTEDGNIPYDVHVNVSTTQATVTSGIKTDPASVTVVTGGTADITMLFGNDVTNKSLEFMSSNGSIASISDLGSYKYRITGVGQGSASIRFRTSDGRFETSCSVTVTGGSTSGGGSTGGNTSTSSEYAKSCTPEYILDKMYPMGQAHEAIPSGLITDTWKYNSRWENQDRPIATAHNCGQSGCPGTGAFQALGCWSNVYRVEGTPFSQNTGVEMKDIKVYGWYNGQWELVQHLPVPNGNFYAESFGGDAAQHFSDSVKQTTTSKTVILREKNKITAMNWDTGQPQEENCMYHPFSDIKNFNTKYEYIYTCIDLRKVKWDKNGVDDRDQTHYCSNCGGDWWLAEGLMFHDSWQHNKGVCQPKMIEITKEWRRFSMTTVPQNWQYGFPE